MRLTFITTFPDAAWELYAREALGKLRAHLPPEVKICVALDSNRLSKDVRALLGPGDEVKDVWQPDHQEFVARNASRDHPTEYRLKATPFCHKIFNLHYFFEREKAAVHPPDFLVWWDADGVIHRPVAMDELEKLMPGAGEAVSYLGRMDWDHSECGFLAYNVKHEAATAILDFMHYYYTSGTLFSLEQWHDSYIFDQARAGHPCRNLSEGMHGNNVWSGTGLGAFSEHRKGRAAKERGKALDDREFYERIHSN